jgi:hypothetical protein
VLGGVWLPQVRRAKRLQKEIDALDATTKV